MRSLGFLGTILLKQSQIFVNCLCNLELIEIDRGSKWGIYGMSANRERTVSKARLERHARATSTKNSGITF